ncbi:MAG: hypothetical protein ACRDL5_03265, partial [Solirubrobacteraceae bacterium]
MLIERWRDGEWSIAVGAPASADTDQGLSSISCSSPTLCTAVGTENQDQPLAEDLVGDVWTSESSKLPNGQSSGDLYGVECVSPSTCIAVGATGSPEDLAFVERFSGASGSAETVPDPPVAEAVGLNSVSCPSNVFCAVVGSVNTPAAEQGQAFAEVRDDGAWSTVPVPVPAGAIISELWRVSCTSSHFCAAVGGYCYDGCMSEGTLMDTWNGSTWTLWPPQNPTDESALSGVSCVSDQDCIAIGSASTIYDWYSTMHEYGPSYMLAGTWNGSGWSVQTQPTDGGGGEVSCSSSSSCLTLRSGSEYWDGQTWSPATEADPNGVLSD